jgi:hypothetical protein
MLIHFVIQAQMIKYQTKEASSVIQPLKLLYWQIFIAAGEAYMI